MWGLHWFYWWGVVFNVLFFGGLAMGLCGSLYWYLKDWREESKFWKERESGKHITTTLGKPEDKLKDNLKDKLEAE